METGHQITLDGLQIIRDLQDKQAAVEAAADGVTAAQARLDDARRELLAHQRLVELVRKYTVTDDPTAAPLPSVGPLTDMTGSAALAQFVDTHPGVTMKLELVYEAMQSLGYSGSVNSIQVALSQMARAGQVIRVSKGLYMLSPADVAFGDLDDESEEPHRPALTIASGGGSP